jgi:hypothetical protein
MEEAQGSLGASVGGTDQLFDQERKSPSSVAESQGDVVGFKGNVLVNGRK